MNQLLFFGNNRVGAEVLQRLLQSSWPLAAVVHHDQPTPHMSAPLQECRSKGIRILTHLDLRKDVVRDELLQSPVETGLSCYYGYKIPEWLSSHASKGIFNIHPSLLPFNRGRFTNVWSIVEQTPSGSTLHQITEEFDRGPLVAQIRVPVLPSDTGATLYTRLEDASLRLFEEAWPCVMNGSYGLCPQEPGGTSHTMNDVRQIDHIELDRSYRASDLINILRARTFPPFEGAYFTVEGRKYFLRLEIDREDQETDE